MLMQLLLQAQTFINNNFNAFIQFFQTLNGGGNSSINKFDGLRNTEADFKNQEKLAEHFNNHGKDFGSMTETEYLESARNFFNNPSSTIESFTSEG